MTVSGQNPVGYSYDNADRLTQISQGSTTNVVIVPDSDGRRQSLTLPNGVKMGYGYDAASQLTGITYTLGSNTLGNLTYSYDLAGRRTNVGGSFARTGVPRAVSSATYNVNNQLTNWKGTGLTYDANGNLTNDGTNTYTWNARNQLVSVSGAVNASFQYDAFGRRVSKTIGGTTQFLYDGANPVQEISGTSASPILLTGGVDEYFQRTDSAGPRNFLTDALGSTLALTDSVGTVQTSYTFEPFGNTTTSGAATTSSFAFTGRELDATGLYFYRARYYSPSIGRFMSEDPVGFGGGINLYGYAGQNPISLRDSFGLQSFGDRIAAIRAQIQAGAAKAALWGRKAWNWGSKVDRCAASTSQAGSLNAISQSFGGKDIPLVGGNVFGDVTALIAGPEPGTDSARAGLDRVNQAAAVGLEGVAEPILTHAAGNVAVGTFTSVSTPVSSVAGVYNPITIAETSASLGGDAIAGGILEFLSGVGEVKLAYDAEILLLSYGACFYAGSVD